MALANFANLFGGEDVPSRVLALKRSAPPHVRHISSGSIPTQVVQAIIPRVAVIVAPIHSVGAWAVESEKHKAVNHPRPADFVTKVQFDLQVTASYLVGSKLIPSAALSGTPHATVVSDTVAGESRNIAVFNH